MNIFILAEDPVESASYHCDKHIARMIMEAAQAISIIAHNKGITYPGQYLPNLNIERNAATIWLAESQHNRMWTLLQCYELDNQRFIYVNPDGKPHESLKVMVDGIDAIDGFGGDWKQHTPFRLSMGKQHHIPGEPILSYRNFYRLKQERFKLEYKGRPRPWWL